MVSGYQWMDRAACAGQDPELWFPDGSDVVAAERARTVCAGCPAREQCLDYALHMPLSYGIFAGTTPAERAQLRAERGIKGRPGPMWLAPHGTPAAYKRHQRAGERPCDACYRAEQIRAEPYNAARRAASSAAAQASRAG